MENINKNVYSYSYNYYLYTKRLELNMKERQFAKLFKMSYFRYHLIERGYVKPNKKEINRISEYFNINFNYYLDSYRSCPTEINDKKSLKISEFIYNLFTKKAFKITIGSFVLIFTLAIIITNIISGIINNKAAAFYDHKVNEFKTQLNDLGDDNYSLLYYDFPIIQKVINLDENNQKAVIISGSYNESNYDFSYKEIIWYNDFRYVIELYYSEGNTANYNVLCTSYETYKTDYLILEEENGVNKISSLFSKEKTDGIITYENNLLDIVISEDINNLVKEKLALDFEFDLFEMKKLVLDGKKAIDRISPIVSLIYILSIIFLAIFGFIFLYALIYQKKKNEEFLFSHSDKLLGLNPMNKPIKKDIRFFPFIPELSIRIIGIILVAFGATRLLVYAETISTFSSDNLQIANMFYSIQMLGMFFIFFINFDIFMDDTRLFRNLLLYAIAYILVYAFEASLVESLKNSQSILTDAISLTSLPNPFGSATCYFLIMFFLFFTPKIIKTKKRLIFFRLMSLLPIAFLIIAFIIGHSNEILGFDIASVRIKYIFKEDRFPLSALAILYLVTLFFMRLYFKHKYGEEKAERFFMSNKFIWMKNLMATSYIILIWLIEIANMNNKNLNKIGIGINYFLIILAPLILFYHPHKGKRNTKTDVIFTTIYILILIFIYALVALSMTISILENISNSI